LDRSKNQIMSLPISLEALRVLDAIERRGSFAGAAAELNRVASAVSYAVQKLEEDLGVVLFDREGHRARLTATGRLVLTGGRELLAAADRLALEARQLHGGWETELRIAIDNLCEAEALFPLVEDFHRHQPDTSVRLLDEVLGGPWEALETDRADLAIATVLASGVPAGVRVEHLRAIPFVMAAAPDHPICAVPEPIDEESLRRHALVVVADSARIRPPISIGLLERQTTVTVSTFRAKERALVAGLGVGSLPEHRLAPLAEAGHLRALRTVRPRDPAMLVLAWKSSGGGRAKRWFLNRIPALLGAP
jgi:DNA-binding transcriptional LysR family regulator